jgi:ectoine hydroxylase-related dioxygenase (phytanoyl-CoA dioxygenase family)
MQARIDQATSSAVAQGVASEHLPRVLTDDEQAAFRRDGWVKLDSFIARELADELLRAAKARMGEEPAEVEQEPSGFTGGNIVYNPAQRLGGRVVDAGYWQDYHYIARDDQVEPFRTLAFSREIGHAAQQLIGRDIPVRYNSDFVACKMPFDRPGGNPTTWHQDDNPFDRTGALIFWVALDEVTPEMGAMRFLSGSHHEGPLGRTRVQGKSVIEYYPELLTRYELSPPLHLSPGDATAHAQFVCHGAPENTTDRPRWSYHCAYFPADTLYLPVPNHNFDGIGLELNKPLEHPRFPVVYP